MRLTTETTFFFDTFANRGGKVKAGELQKFLAHLPSEAALDFVQETPSEMRVIATYDVPNTHHITGTPTMKEPPPLHKNSSGGPCRCRFPVDHTTTRGPAAEAEEGKA